MIPTFSIIGGKARLRKWLVEQFGQTGPKIYCEPFCGRANVFYYLWTNFPDYAQYYILADTNILHLQLLKKISIEKIKFPVVETRSQFDYWRDRWLNHKDPIAKLIEPRITLLGAGYEDGRFAKTYKRHKGYNPVLYKKMCLAAQHILRKSNVKLIQQDFRQTFSLIQDEMENDCFVYCDPPYYTEFITRAKHLYGVEFGESEHTELIGLLNKLRVRIRWAISGYQSPLYDDYLCYTNRYVKKRNSEMASLTTGRKCPVNEILWTNF